jgi:hypothetical protein
MRLQLRSRPRFACVCFTFGCKCVTNEFDWARQVFACTDGNAVNDNQRAEKRSSSRKKGIKSHGQGTECGWACVVIHTRRGGPTATFEQTRTLKRFGRQKAVSRRGPGALKHPPILLSVLGPEDTICKQNWDSSEGGKRADRERLGT